MKTVNNSRMYSGAGVINQENPLNSPGVSNGQGYNTFDLSQQVGLTPRFGELTPFHVRQCEIGDRFNLRSSHQLNSFTLASPLLSEVRMNKDYFYVPKSAMLPNTWEYLFVNPNRGDDVPEDAFPVFDVKTFYRNLLSAFSHVMGTSSTSASDNPFFGWILSLLWKFADNGTLLDYLGYRTHIYQDYDGFGHVNSSPSGSGFASCFDKFIDFLITSSQSENVTLWLYNVDITATGATLAGVLKKGTLEASLSSSSGFDKAKLRGFFYRYMNSDNPYWLTITHGDTNEQVNYNTYLPLFQNYINILNVYLSDNYDYIKPYNLYRLIAYQMVCAQFYSNDVVDNVFTSKLWLQNMESIQRYAVGAATLNPTYFARNGISIRYDVMSKHNLDLMISRLGSTSYFDVTTSESLPAVRSIGFYILMFFGNLFEFGHALRYGDYFCGARTQPLAVGDVDVAVNSNMVSAIDMTRGIAMQRFLNAINRVGQLVADYARNIFGVVPKNLPPQPRFVNHESAVVGGQTVTNTAESQGELNQNFVSNGSKFSYDVFIDEPGYLIGIVSFKCSPAYTQTTPRDIFHYDRLDDFQPFLQDIGDQEVFIQELRSIGAFRENTWNGESVHPPYAYQLQDAEYKYAVNEIHGGLVKTLPTWFFVQNVDYASIVSEFLRLYPYQFDKFYKSLTGCSSESYYHFIISFVNKVTANRRMMYRPGIL